MPRRPRSKDNQYLIILLHSTKNNNYGIYIGNLDSLRFYSRLDFCILHGVNPMFQYTFVLPPTPAQPSRKSNLVPGNARHSNLYYYLRSSAFSYIPHQSIIQRIDGWTLGTQRRTNSVRIKRKNTSRGHKKRPDPENRDVKQALSHRHKIKNKYNNS